MFIRAKKQPLTENSSAHHKIVFSLEDDNGNTAMLLAAFPVEHHKPMICKLSNIIGDVGNESLIFNIK